VLLVAAESHAKVVHAVVRDSAHPTTSLLGRGLGSPRARASGGGNGGLSAGARAGVTFFGIYGGLTATYVGRGGYGTLMSPSTDFAVRSWALGAEVGYDFALPLTATLRPYIGLGDQIYEVDTTLQTQPPVSSSTATHRFYAAPGATFVFQPFAPLELGLDLRFVLPARTGNDNADSFAYGTAGVAF
jgi:hypothetical protein